MMRQINWLVDGFLMVSVENGRSVILNTRKDEMRGAFLCPGTLKNRREKCHMRDQMTFLRG